MIVSLCILGTVHHMIVILVHIYKMMISPANFFINKILILGDFSCVKG